jgi:hypothetical protein
VAEWIRRDNKACKCEVNWPIQWQSGSGEITKLVMLSKLANSVAEWIQRDNKACKCEVNWPIQWQSGSGEITKLVNVK